MSEAEALATERIEAFTEAHPGVEFALGHIVLSDLNLDVGSIAYCLAKQFTPYGEVSPEWRADLPAEVVLEPETVRGAYELLHDLLRTAVAERWF
jgi:hypothetical protein